MKAILISVMVVGAVSGWLAAAEIAVEPRLKARLEWFGDQKFGLLVHWGAYSQWGCIESWPLVEVDPWARPDDLKAWTDRNKDIGAFIRDYWQLPKTFNPKRFDPQQWAGAAKYAGMKYVVFTTKHHDGFCMFDTKLTEYRTTAADCPFHTNPKANVVKEVFETFRKEGFGIGAYFSKADWHSEYYWDPKRPAKARNPNYDTKKEPERWGKFVEFVHGQVEELMSGYGPVDILWLDAGQVRPPEQDIQMDRLAAMARKYQPNLIVVDRTVGGKHENYRTPEQEVPDRALAYVWESCLTMGDQWSYKADDKYKSTHKLIQLLVDIVAKGGNFLLNVGPSPDGEFPEPALVRLKEIGDWMKVNGEAIYGSRPVPPYKEGSVAFTRKGEVVYAIYLAKADGGGLPETIELSALKPRAGSELRMLGVAGEFLWAIEGGKTVIRIPAGVRQAPPCGHAWVVKFELDGK
ncbi:MAG: alpha-L-fucosidase [Planctomycetota bacterium]|nr:alpha-L-fucosidase [Planctomycetota bacterium]